MRDGLSRDKRRLAAGLLLMALTFATAFIGVFLLGRPGDGAMAPGVPFLVGSGWVLVLAAAVVFYRSYAGEPEDDPPAGAAGGSPEGGGP